MSAPLLVASSGARDVAGVAEDAASLPPEVGLVEVRLDRFEDPEAVDLRALRAAIPRPAIFTLRWTQEGGGFRGSPSRRAALHRAADEAGFDWLDLEADVAATVARGKAKRIVSWHGESFGDDGAARVASLAGLDADVIKVAAGIEHPLAALRFVREACAAAKGVVAIAMGPAGRWLRPLAGRFSMPLVYAAIHPSRKTADGQITVDEALHLHRVLAVSPATRVYAVAGADVRRSLSPRVHHAAFRAAGLDAAYVDLSAPDFATVRDIADALLDGLSITAPFKRDALEQASEADDEARAVGAANTWLRRDTSGFRATNTDAAGFRAAVELALREPSLAADLVIDKSREALRRLSFVPSLAAPKRIRTALVYGTGGAARAAAVALRAMGAKVHVTGRDQGAALALVLSVGAGLEAISEGRATSLTFDLLVKAVPDSPDGELPLDPFDFRPEGWAADVVYHPLDTPFLLAARRAGRIPIPGLLMFAAQAALQSAAFTGLTPERALEPIAAALAG